MYHRMTAMKAYIGQGDVPAVSNNIERLAALHCAAITPLGYHSIPTIVRTVNINSVLSRIDGKRVTPLVAAATVQCLLSLGANPNAFDSKDVPALYYAMQRRDDCSTSARECQS